MPTYSLLGATGATGSAILRSLLSEAPPDLRLNLFVRSKKKLLEAFPQLESSLKFSMSIIEGPISDQVALQECLKGTNVIFMCIATNHSVPGVSVALDIAGAVVDALESLRNEDGLAFKPPTILQLRSTSLNDISTGFGATMAHFCFHYVYADLERACALYESKAKEMPGLFQYIVVDPPALHDSDGTTPTGHKLLTQEMLKAEPYSSILSYADLGAAFCELAVRKDEFLGQSLVVSATGAVKQTWGTLVGYMFEGIRGRILG